MQRSRAFSITAAGALAFSAITLAAPSGAVPAPNYDNTPFMVGCYATHGHGYTNLDARIQQCFWQDENTGNEHVENEPLPPDPLGPVRPLPPQSQQSIG
jgi:hypothetical protein